MFILDKIEKDSTVLEIAQPIIQGYNHYAHMLSILNCHSKTLSWVYSNFIQIYMNKNLYKNSWGDFYYPFPYEIRLSDTCKWLYNSRVRRSMFDGKPDRLIKFVKNELEDGFYLHMDLNHYHIKIPGKNDVNFHHDALIHGIDMDKKIIYVSDNFLFGKYERRVITFSEFINAFYDCEVKKLRGFLNDMIYSYKVKEECNYEFNLDNINNLIIEYYEGKIPEYWRIYNCSNSENVIFGRKVYCALYQYIEDIEENNCKEIDIRHFYLMVDHKEIMIKRFEYLCDIGDCRKEDLTDVIEKYHVIYEKHKILLFTLVKYLLTNDSLLLLEVKKMLKLIEQIEYEALTIYIDKCTRP